MKRTLLVLLAAVMCLLLAGCDMWMDGSYYSVEPHQHEYSAPVLESAEVASYAQLRDALFDMVADGTQESMLYMIGFDTDRLGSIMDMAIRQTTHGNAIGAYAVDTITYEIGTNTGRTAVAVNISYLHNRSEILRIKHAQDMDETMDIVSEALMSCETGVVIQVESYMEVDFTQKIQDYVNSNPDTCMEMPQVTAAVYPETGSQRVIELSFTYQTSRESLRTMQSYVEPVFRAANLNVSGEEEESTKFSRMYAFLMEREDYQIKTSITPAYSLLRHGVGDSKAFATVYAAMCRQAGLDCRIVTGTRNGEPWVWNMICEGGVYSHVDLLRSMENGHLERMSDEDMGGYVWDYSAYPAAEHAESGTSDAREETNPPEEIPAEPDTTAPAEEIETPVEESEEPTRETEETVASEQEEQVI